MKLYITHTCGHDEEHNITGPVRERPRREEWLAQEACRDCKRADGAKQREKQHAKNAEQADAFESAANLPELVGTEKQIAWARTIRATALPEIAARFVVIKQQADASDHKNAAAAMKLAVEIQNEWQQETAAKWWIEHREDETMRYGLQLDAEIRTRFAKQVDCNA